MNKRIVLGIFTAVILQFVLSETLGYLNELQGSYDDSFLSLTIKSAIIPLVSITAGAYVAKTGFLISSIAIWFVEWLAITHVLMLIGYGRYTFSDMVLIVFKSNWQEIAVSLLFTVIGVKLGYAARTKLQTTQNKI